MSSSTLPTTVELLGRVIDSGEVVTIAYNGGSRPGQARQVVPLLLSAGELVGTERGSSVRKTYKLDLIVWVELSSGQRATNPDVLPPVPPTPPARVIPDVPLLLSLPAYVAHYRTELIAAGWHLYEEADSFGVGTRFKSGKPKKTPSIWLRYFAPNPASTAPRIESVSLVLSVSTKGELESFVETTEARARMPRQWRVDSWRLSTGKTFAELRPAFALFIDEARQSDPGTAKGAFAGH